MATICLAGQEKPVSNIYCIGRNYAEHIKELNNATPTEPIVFLKPTASIIKENELIKLPEFSQEVHHECELIVYINRNANNISTHEAMNYIGGYGIGLDLTARDIQAHAKNNGLPWTKAKGFRSAACCSSFVEPHTIHDIHKQSFNLEINGIVRQQGNTADMIYSIPELISYLSNIYGLQAGDLIFTGTPSGVGAIQSGDKLQLNWHHVIQAFFQVQ